MNSEIKQILEAVQRGEMDVDDALLRIKTEPFEDIGYAKVDLHRKVPKLSFLGFGTMNGSQICCTSA